LDNFTPDNENELLMRAAEGEEAAFTRLFYAYHNKLGAYICRLTGSIETAEEIVQDVFVKVWDNRQALATVNCFGSYIYVLSRNHALNCLRKLAKERIRSREIVQNIQQSCDHDHNQWDETTPDYYMLIDQAVDELPPQQQKAYILSRREHMQYDEVALRMNISRETVKKYLKLATRFITRYVHTHGDLLVVILLLSLGLV
jgi:RNA polymerase sigma-70 factor (ECF subfamily)